MANKERMTELTSLAIGVAEYVEDHSSDRVDALAALEMASTMLSILPEEAAQERS